jgi:hypothetical protein
MTSQVKLLITKNTFRIVQRATAQSKTGNFRDYRGLRLFTKLPSLSSAGSQSGRFRTALGCKPRSLKRVSIGSFDHLFFQKVGRTKVSFLSAAS